MDGLRKHQTISQKHKAGRFWCIISLSFPNKSYNIIFQSVESILVNIFGGIMRCDVIAEGVVAAAREVSLDVPLVVRLAGTNVELGKKILEESGLPIVSADNLADAAEKVVKVTKEAA